MVLGKNKENEMKKLLLTIAMMTTQTTLAAAADIWEGSGTLFDTKGNATGKYSLLVDRQLDLSARERKAFAAPPDKQPFANDR